MGSGAPVDVPHDGYHGSFRIPEGLWAERRDSELQVIPQSHLTPDAVAALDRVAGRRLRTWLAEELHGTLLGLLDEAGDAPGIGVLRHIQFASHRIVVRMAGEGIAGIRGMQWSRTRMGLGGELRSVSMTEM
jgi:polynucleotide 5'-kinase involved in rRNA processing